MIDTAKVSFYEVLKGCERALKTELESFYPDKNFGSRLRDARIGNEEMLALARQALDHFDGVYVKSLKLENGKAVIEIMINSKKGEVRISL